MNKVEEIFKSWMISFSPDDAQADIAAKRIEICDSCEFKTLTPIGPFMSIARCSICGCALRAKIFTPRTYLDGIIEQNDSNQGSCPRSFWTSVEKEWLINKGDTRIQ